MRVMPTPVGSPPFSYYGLVPTFDNPTPSQMTGCTHVHHHLSLYHTYSPFHSQTHLKSQSPCALQSFSPPAAAMLRLLPFLCSTRTAGSACTVYTSSATAACPASSGTSICTHAGQMWRLGLLQALSRVRDRRLAPQAHEARARRAGVRVQGGKRLEGVNRHREGRTC